MKHVAQYSPLLHEPTKADIARTGPQHSIRERFHRERLPLSELPQFLNRTYKLDVPVYTVWGACEDVSVLEKLRSGEYKVDNLHVIDESHSRLLDVGGVKLRLLGLGGAVVMHKMFDNGEGRTTIAGGQGTMWTTILQIGELIDTASRVFDMTETRVLITHASTAREGLLNQLGVALKADFSISAGLHFRYGSSYNEFSVNPSLDHYRGKLSASKTQFNDVWETVKHEVEPAVSENDAQNRCLRLALDLVSRMPATAGGGNPFGGGPTGGQVDESAFKNMWNFNLADAAFGWLVLDIDQGRIGTEMRAQGFNFSHRGGRVQQRPQAIQSASSASAVVPAVVSSPTPGQPASQAVQPQARVPPQVPVAQPARTPQQTPQHNPTGQKPAASPAPPAQAANGPSASPASQPKMNGTVQANETPKATEPVNQAKTPKSPIGPESSKGIFINGSSNLATAEDVKTQLFAPGDVEKITNLEKTPKGPWVAHFATPEIMQDVLKRNNTKEAHANGIRMTQYRTHGSGRGGFGAGTWGSNRVGYQSTGGATTGSDSETNRGGRGRGGRGYSRGRGRGGRGGGGDRGGTGKVDAPAAATTPSGGGDA